MNFPRIMLSEKNQSQNVTSCVTPFIWHSWSGILIGMGNRLVVAKGKKGWGQEGHGQDEKKIVWGILSVMGIFFILVFFLFKKKKKTKLMNISFLGVVLCYGFVTHYHWGKLGKEHMWFLYPFLTTACESRLSKNKSLKKCWQTSSIPNSVWHKARAF